MVFIKKDQAKRGDVGNYRPISLLCSMSKIHDKFFVDKLEREIEEKSQFGFRKGLGTTPAISSLVNLVQGQRVWGKTVGVIFVDLRKAFDSVDHSLLIDRMKQMGIDGNLIDYFKDFLSSRHFISSRVMRTVVDLRDLHRVTSHSINSGVLQGSISGPVLFSLFIDVVLRRVPDSVAYADDLAIVEGGRNVAEMELDLNRRVNQLEEIFDSPDESKHGENKGCPLPGSASGLVIARYNGSEELLHLGPCQTNCRQG